MAVRELTSLEVYAIYAATGRSADFFGYKFSTTSASVVKTKPLAVER